MTCKWHELTPEKFWRATGKWNESRISRIKWLYFINKNLWDGKETRAYFNTVDKAMFEYYRITSKQIKPLPIESQLSEFCYPSVGQKNGKLLLFYSENRSGNIWSLHVT